ncbi:MAG: ParB/RepB/Spo0J family partition protein [Gammaproteobacteria bacterium]|nr:ParB/RepB/Spo0J family partition protein [Gammaproteobacteria bacterium]MCY4314129.1 ParB/RepB/Spo0J family partition protein [Gammaproteobacteria bacterium]
MAEKKSRLGRGLGALLDDIKTTTQTVEDLRGLPDTSISKSGHLKEISITQLLQGRYQPRKNFDAQELDELAESIRAQGILQPLLVRQVSDHEYEIVAGERRWRGAQLAGLDTVPVVVRQIDDQAAMAAALVENIQRQDLGVLEMARGFKRLLDEFKLTHDDVAGVVGCSRSHVTNLTRLLNLENKVLELLQEGRLEMGHARALLALPEPQQKQVALKIVEKNLSVRQTEFLVKQLLKDGNGRGRQDKKQELGRDVLNTVESLSNRIGARVDIQHGANKGKLIIHYHSLDELDGIIERIK